MLALEWLTMSKRQKEKWRKMRLRQVRDQLLELKERSEKEETKMEVDRLISEIEEELRPK
jgi:hypothetical protein